ncbi:MAG: hypothetical protein H7Y20_16235 [Bryobacteraceae bacterium]|nr:hypothetical protein [Bryobacteraceae bacterium]
MAPTSFFTDSYKPVRDEFEAISATQSSSSPTPLQIPALLWAGLILFAVNAIILLFVIISPGSELSMYGQQSVSAYPGYKPSPFSERVEVGARPKLKVASKMVPIVHSEPLMIDPPALGELDLRRATQLSLPRATPVAVRN